MATVNTNPSPYSSIKLLREQIQDIEENLGPHCEWLLADFPRDVARDVAGDARVAEFRLPAQTQ